MHAKDEGLPGNNGVTTGQNHSSWLPVAWALLAGLLLGMTITLLLAQQASAYYFHQVRHREAIQEELAARRALVVKNFVEAESHLRTKLSLTQATVAREAPGNEETWPLLFPFLGDGVELLYEKVPDTAFAAREAESHAELGWVLEQSGKLDAAQLEYAIAATQMGYSSPDQGRSLGRELLR